MNTIFKTGTFMDFKGVEHKFTVAGTIVNCPDSVLSQPTDSEVLFDDEGCVVYDSDETPVIIDNYIDIAPIHKVISIGISICNPGDGTKNNPGDTYNEKRGRCQSEGRALKYMDRVVAFSKGGMCTEAEVEYFVNQTVNNLIQSPGLFIKGYNEAAKKYKLANG